MSEPPELNELRDPVAQAGTNAHARAAMETAQDTAFLLDAEEAAEQSPREFLLSLNMRELEGQIEWLKNYPKHSHAVALVSFLETLARQAFVRYGLQVTTPEDALVNFAVQYGITPEMLANGLDQATVAIRERVRTVGVPEQVRNLINLWGVEHVRSFLQPLMPTPEQPRADQTPETVPADPEPVRDGT